MNKKRGILILLAGTIIMMVVMAKTGASLNTAATPLGILDLEFAYNNAKTAAVLNAWSLQPGNTIDNISAAKINTYLDFIFLLFYSLLLFFTCDKIAVINKSKTGVSIANGAIWAGLLDIVENGGMLMTLSGNGSATVAFITSFCSIIKWGLAIAAVLYALGGIIQLTFQKKFHLLLS
jgi:hypothetical protein